MRSQLYSDWQAGETFVKALDGEVVIGEQKLPLRFHIHRVLLVVICLVKSQQVVIDRRIEVAQLPVSSAPVG